MIEFKATKKQLTNIDGNCEVVFSIQTDNISELDNLPADKVLTVTVAEYKPKRSLSQNSYLWKIIGEISKSVKSPKETIYRQYIKDYGVYQVLPIKEESVDKFTTAWESHGIGWFVEDLGESKLDGFRKVIAYYGSSVYDSKEMSAIVDAVVTDAEELGIQTISTEEWKGLQNLND